MNLKPGVKLLKERIGDGKVVVRQQHYLVKIRITLNKGEIVKTPQKCLSHSIDKYLIIHDDGYFEHRVRIDREQLLAGVFYAIDGMRVGGYRKVAIAPHLAYQEKGIPGIIPENAKLVVEIEILREANL